MARAKATVNCWEHQPNLQLADSLDAWQPAAFIAYLGIKRAHYLGNLPRRSALFCYISCGYPLIRQLYNTYIVNDFCDLCNRVLVLFSILRFCCIQCIIKVLADCFKCLFTRNCNLSNLSIWYHTCSIHNGLL